MAAAQVKEDDLVEVRVLAKLYGSAREGEIVKVARAEYERNAGRMSSLSGKVVGASLRLLSDEKKAVDNRVSEQQKKQELHLARRKQFQEQAQAAHDAQIIRAEAEAKAAGERVAQLKRGPQAAAK